MVAGRVPPCARPIEAPTRDSVAALQKSLDRIHAALGEDGFPEDHMLELKQLAEASLAQPLQIQWCRVEVQKFLNAEREGPQVNYQPTGAYRALPFQIMAGKFYLVNPSDDKEPGDDMYATI
jgi:hypothetical protein